MKYVPRKGEGEIAKDKQGALSQMKVNNHLNLLWDVEDGPEAYKQVMEKALLHGPYGRCGKDPMCVQIPQTCVLVSLRLRQQRLRPPNGQHGI